jgi:hypothetical protein
MSVNLNKLRYKYVYKRRYIYINTGAIWLVFCRLCMNYQISDNSFNK